MTNAHLNTFILQFVDNFGLKKADEESYVKDKKSEQ